MVRNLPKINSYLKENSDRDFSWGEFDCCLFACDIVVLAGGEDFAKDVRGKYSSEQGAKRVLKSEFGSIENAFSSLPEVLPAFAQRGDLVLFDTENGKVMALAWACGYIAISPDNGLGFMKDTSKPIKAWRVG